MKKLSITVISFVVVLIALFILQTNKVYAVDDKILDAINSGYSFNNGADQDIYKIKETDRSS